MPFNYLGTMRVAQWKAFRNWTLNERKAVSARMRAIDAELRRIGRITVVYQQVEEAVQTPSGAEQLATTVNEKRVGFIVSQGSTLEKLVQCYVACGGNPMSISMWLQPDEVQFKGAVDPIDNVSNNRNEPFNDNYVASSPPDQPYYGAVAGKSATTYGPRSGTRYDGGLPTFIRDPQTLAGRYFSESDASTKIQTRMDYGRRWVQQAVCEAAALEHKIMKIMDLRECLKKERDEVVQQAVGGSVSDFPIAPDSRRFARILHLTGAVSVMDRTFYNLNSEGEPDFDSVKFGTKDNPEGISNYSTLFGFVEGTDDFATG
jgi:hypothetical protein